MVENYGIAFKNKIDAFDYIKERFFNQKYIYNQHFTKEELEKKINERIEEIELQ